MLGIEKPDIIGFMGVIYMSKIQNIFKKHYPEYERNHPIADHARKAAWKIMNCRTQEMGGHIQKCPDGHYARIFYNSCKHRSCPQCNVIEKEEWLQKQAAKLINTGHFHIVFTIDHDINVLWLTNPKILTDVLFKSAKEVLFGMLENEEKFLGVRPGMIATLQTWGQTLIYHPHLHCLVTGGGITKAGLWKEENKGYLIPVEELSKIFKKRFIDKLHNLTYKGKIKRPKGMSYSEIHRMLRRVKKKDWAVFIREKYPYGEGVVKYLARYIKGGAISDKRIIYWDKKIVRFKYKDNLDGGKRKVLELKTEEFIRRYLLHVPKPYLHVVRYYGLYSSSKKEELKRIKEQLGQEIKDKEIEISWQDYCEAQGGDEHPEACPICGKKLVRGRSFTAKELRDEKNKFIIEKYKMAV